jgi:hypothetical protein
MGETTFSTGTCYILDSNGKQTKLGTLKDIKLTRTVSSNEAWDMVDHIRAVGCKKKTMNVIINAIRKDAYYRDMNNDNPNIDLEVE